jgi:hypothetical protein
MIDAIYKLNPSVVTVRNGVAYDKDENIVEYDKDAVQAYINAHAYVDKRVAEYPPIGDQLDALWKGGAEAEAMLAKVQAIKAKYPKGAA